MTSNTRRFQFFPFLINMLVPMVFAAAGGLLTAAALHNWYPGIQKPSFNPPNWIFGPVWSTIFILMGISSYLVWQKRAQITHFSRTIAIYFIQLVLNLMWSFLFFYTHLIGAALAEMLTLLVVIVINALVFYRIDKTAGLLFIPYFLWVSFATFLTYNIFILNQV